MQLEKLRLPYREDTVFSLLALAIFFVPLVFSQFSYENFESVKFSILLLLVGGAGALFFWSQWPKQAGLKINRTLFYWLAAFFILATLSAILAPDHLYAFFGFYYRYTSGWVFLFSFLLFIVLLWQRLDGNRLEYLMKILSLDGLVVGLFSFFQGLGWLIYPGLIIPGFFRGPSLLGNSNYSAAFLAAVVPLSLYSLLGAKSFAGRIYYSLVIFWEIFAIFLLFSRGALLALLAACVFLGGIFVLFKFSRKFFLAALLAVLLMVGFGLVLTHTVRPQGLSIPVLSQDPNTVTRLYAWKVSLNMIVQHPIFGVGLGNYAMAFERNQLPAVAGAIGIFDDAHNLFLQLAATGGIPFLICFIGALAAAAMMGLKNLKEKNLLAAALLASLVAWVVAACFNPVPIPMYMLLGIILVALSFERTEVWTVGLRDLFKTGLFVLSFALSLFGLTTLVSEHFLGIAAAAYSAQDYKTSYQLANLAYYINPTNQQFLIYRASSAINLGKSREQIEADVQEIVRMHPGQSASYVSASDIYGQLYYERQGQDNLLAAINNLQIGLRLDPYFAARWGQLGLYEYNLGQFDDAEKAVERDLSLNNKDFSSWIVLAKLRQLKADRTGTINALTEAFKIDPQSLQLKYILTLAKRLADIKLVPIVITVLPPQV